SVSPRAAAPRPWASWAALVAGPLVAVPLIVLLAPGPERDPRDVPSPLVGRAAPDFALTTVDGDREVTLTSLRGKPSVVSFFSTWCGGCERDHPLLLATARLYGDRVNVVGIAFEDTRAKLNAWLDRHGGRGYPVLVDVGGPAAAAYGVYGVPETFFIDASGVIRSMVRGPVTPETLESELDAMD
ncbi:MAG: redoxin domain-containing protein, partial [Deltaproteobacteria bacterium]